MKKVTLISLFVFLIQSSFAQIQEVNLLTEKRDISHIERTLERFVKSNKLPGVSFILANKGRIVYSKSFGYGYVEKKIPLKPEHRMKIGLSTRTVTAALIMKLIEDGKLSLEDNVFGPDSIFANEFPRVDKLVAEVTIRHLLEDTAGKGWSVLAPKNPARFFNGNDHMQNIRNGLKNLKEKKAPGNEIYRSTFGYYILGRVIEKLSEKTYLEYMKKTFADVLQGEVSLTHQTENKNVAVHYDDRRNIRRTEGDTYDDCTSGIICSPTDFMNMLLAIDGRPAQKDVLLPATVRIMYSPSRFSKYDGKGYKFDDAGNIGLHWYSSNSSTTFWVGADGLSWVMCSNGISNRGSFYKDFYGLPHEIVKKLKKIP